MKLKPKIRNRSFQSGFTLIEAIVATALFATVVSGILGVYLSTLQLDRKVRAQRLVNENARFIMDFIGKEIRNGTVDYSAFTPDGNCTTAGHCLDLYIKNQAQDTEHFYVSNTNCSAATPCDLILVKNSGTPTNLNPTAVKITNLRFYIRPLGDPFTTAKSFNIQPNVTVVMELTSIIGPNAQDRSKLALESTFTTRVYPRRAVVSASSGPICPPTGWNAQDIGAVGVPGSTCEEAGVFTVKGSGADIFDAADAFQFAYKTVTGDVQIIARLSSLENTDPFAKAGLMIREDLTAGSRNIMVAMTPSNGYKIQQRDTPGGLTTYAFLPGNAPTWMKLVRIGNNFTTYGSINGIVWTPLQNYSNSMSSTIMIGLALTSHNNSVLNTSTFDNVVITPLSASPPPTSNTYLSDLNPTASSNAWGPYERDMSNGDLNAGDGTTITLNGVTYVKGLGTSAVADISYNLGGNCTSLISDIGIDDDVGALGSVVFRVYLDGVLSYDSGLMTGPTATKAVNVNTTGKNVLRLLITDGGDGNGYDHGDWAGARVVCSASAPSSSDTYLSDMTPTAASNGWGPYERDMSNGGNSAGDGTTITLNGVTYAKGLGAHASSDITYTLSSCSAFVSDIGVDDEVSSISSVVFQVYLDGVVAYDSGTMTPTTATKSINLNTTGKSQLRLVITDGGDGQNSDHGDWAGAKVTCGGSAPSSSDHYISDLTPTSAANGWGPYEKDMSNGGNGAGDGVTITLNGVTYAKGIGGHATSDITYNIGGTCSAFKSDVGVDDEMTSISSVVFQVYLDGALSYDSGTMTPTTATKSINLNTTGKSQLRLVITDGGDGQNSDHGDWAGAKVTCVP